MVKGILAAAAGALFLGVFAQPTQASGWGIHRETLTFTAPIVLPGGRVLAAGSYIFEIPSVVASHAVVRVSSRDGRHIYLTQFTRDVPASKRAGRAPVTFREVPAGSPRPVDTWYPTADVSGHQFIY